MANAPLVGQDGGSPTTDLPDEASDLFLIPWLDTISENQKCFARRAVLSQAFLLERPDKRIAEPRRDLPVEHDVVRKRPAIMGYDPGRICVSLWKHDFQTGDWDMASNFIAKGADGYEAFMGRWSKRLAPVFLDFAGISDGERVIDVGCGTGSLTFAIAERAAVGSIEAIDFEEPFVEALRRRNKDPRINARQGDACALTFGDNQFDRALSLLVLHFVSDPAKAISEMRRVVRPGGVVAATVWDTFGGMPSQRMFWDTFCAIEPAAVERRSLGQMRPMTRPGEMADAFAAAGLEQIAETSLTIRMDFTSFDDYWLPLIHGQGTLAAFLSTLPATTTDRLQAGVREAYLCGRPDGPRSFPTTAVAVKATVPDN